MARYNIKEELDNSLKRVVKTSFFVFVGIFISKILTYAYKAIIARNFGAEVFGLFSLSLMISGWILAIASFGLDAGLSRYIPFYRGKQQREKIRYLFKHTTSILIISGVIFGVLLFILSETISLRIFNNPQLISFLRIFSIIIPLSLLSGPLMGALKAYEEIGWHSFIFNIFQNAVKLSLLIILIVLGVNSDSIAWSYLSGVLSMVIFAYAILKKKIKELFGKIEIKNAEKKKISKKVWGFSWPLLFYSIIGTMFYWTDTFLLGYFKGASEVGYYNSAITIVMLLIIAPELLTQLFFPLVIKAYSQRKTVLIRNLSKQLTKWIFLVNLPVFLLMFLFPGAFINILFGSVFLVTESALRILAIGILFSSVMTISTHLIYASGKSKIILMNIIISTVINIILNIILIPLPKILFIENSYGLEGAAIATTLSIILLNLLFIIQCKKNFSFIPLRKKMITVALVSVIPTLVLFYLRSMITMNIFSLILISGLFVLLYLLLVLISKSLDKNDWMIIHSIWKKMIIMNNNIQKDLANKK